MEMQVRWVCMISLIPQDLATVLYSNCCDSWVRRPPRRNVPGGGVEGRWTYCTARATLCLCVLTACLRNILTAAPPSAEALLQGGTRAPPWRNQSPTLAEPAPDQPRRDRSPTLAEPEPRTKTTAKTLRPRCEAQAKRSPAVITGASPKGPCEPSPGGRRPVRNSVLAVLEEHAVPQAWIGSSLGLLRLGARLGLRRVWPRRAAVLAAVQVPPLMAKGNDVQRLPLVAPLAANADPADHGAARPDPPRLPKRGATRCLQVGVVDLHVGRAAAHRPNRSPLAVQWSEFPRRGTIPPSGRRNESGARNRSRTNWPSHAPTPQTRPTPSSGPSMPRCARMHA